MSCAKLIRTEDLISLNSSESNLQYKQIYH